jgi:hypothetical protein
VNPAAHYIVFAGTIDGSVQLWDLRETKSAQSLIRPSYSTAGLLDLDSTHQDKIVLIETLENATNETVNNKMSDSFQITTLDSSGTLITWVRQFIYISYRNTNRSVDFYGFVREVLRTQHPNLESRLWHGFRWKSPVGQTLESHFPSSIMVRNFKNKIWSLFSYKMYRLFTVGFERSSDSFISLANMLHDKESILVSSTDGGLFLFNRFDGFERMWDKNDRWATDTNESLLHPEDPVTTIASHPWRSDIFLAGYTSGTLCIFSIICVAPLWKFEPPISMLKGGLDSIKEVAWSTMRPSVFWVLTHSGDVILWDLLQSRSEPQVISISKNSLGRTAMVLSKPSKANRNGRVLFGVDSECAGFEVHHLLDNWMEMQMDEEGEFGRLFDSFKYAF